MKILLIGAPGSGKGSLSELLINNDNFKHISTGNLFRAILSQDDSKQAQEINQYIKNGKLVPDSITNQIAKDAILELTQNNQSFILDGYPRSIAQANELASYLDLDYVFYLNINDDLLIKRLTGRRMCPGCGGIYNIYLKPSKNNNKCENCDKELIQRSDDVLEVVQSRIDTYNQQTLALVDYYQKQNKLIHINADRAVDDIYKEIKKHLN